jgi:hypothetical protein
MLNRKIRAGVVALALTPAPSLAPPNWCSIMRFPGPVPQLFTLKWTHPGRKVGHHVVGIWNGEIHCVHARGLCNQRDFVAVCFHLCLENRSEKFSHLHFNPCRKRTDSKSSVVLLWRNSYCVISLRNILLSHLLTPPRYGVSFSNTPALWCVVSEPQWSSRSFLLKVTAWRKRAINCLDGSWRESWLP